IGNTLDTFGMVNLVIHSTYLPVFQCAFSAAFTIRMFTANLLKANKREKEGRIYIVRCDYGI
ncbi:hypothetical protein L9F63_023766, partial [Diploptera punctata]